jgi:hypothetical protein
MDARQERPERGSDSAEGRVVPAAFSVAAFCRSHGISRSLLYLLWREKRGPRVLRVRGRTLISAEAAADWRREMEAASSGAER